MKIRKILGHPYTLVTSFFLITITGQQASGIYFGYLVLGMSYGAVYSILGTMGIAVILFSHFKYKRYDQSMDESIINLLGAVLLILSLFLFFYHNTDKLSVGIYGQAITLVTLLVFGVLTTCFITLIR